jgi:hypothetical protein
VLRVQKWVVWWLHNAPWYTFNSITLSKHIDIHVKRIEHLCICAQQMHNLFIYYYFCYICNCWVLFQHTLWKKNDHRKNNPWVPCGILFPHPLRQTAGTPNDRYPGTPDTDTPVPRPQKLILKWAGFSSLLKKTQHFKISVGSKEFLSHLVNPCRDHLHSTRHAN